VIDTAKFLAKIDTHKFADGIRNSSGGTAITASNGLTLASNVVKLGSTSYFNAPVSLLAGATNNLTIRTGAGNLTDSVVTTVPNSGIVGRLSTSEVVNAATVSGTGSMTAGSYTKGQTVNVTASISGVSSSSVFMA
jgi:hypothetical protein